MSDNKGFIHLHLHSQYSLLDGAITFERLFERCKELGMDSVAVTDHGNLFGVIEFYTKALASNIKPIIGIEAYVAPSSRFDRTKTSISDAAYHLVLLAKNNTGYQNLLKLATTGYVDGFYYRPRIDKQILGELNEGLIACSACPKGELAMHFVNGGIKAAEEIADKYLKIFGPERYFVEIQSHQGDDPQINQALVDLANRKGIGLVATNDVHFLNEDDHEAHNCLCAISTGKKHDDPDRLIYPNDVFFKSSQQMRELFPQWPQACDNTIEIAKQCNVEIDLKTRHAPHFSPEDGSTPEKFLTDLCYEKAKQIYGKVEDKVKDRLERELQVIQSKGFASYFLIVWDFCNYAHKNNIPVGARGSAVGTLVGYCLGLCDVDPLKYDLLFERFMDPQRNEMPDIDIDMCQVNRGKIIDYVRQKYGQVAQIITFGTMGAKAVIRDICRVLNVPLTEADRLAKLVPETLNMTLDIALESEPQLKQAYDKDPQTKQVIDLSKKLEGLARHASVHAAGIVIADEPLTNFVPLYKPSGTDDIVTQFEGPMVEKVGLLKMDFLGLKTLSVLERAKQLVEQIHGKKIEMEKINLEDPKVFALFAAGKTKGVFQFESGGMQELLMKMKPDRIQDLIAANALYRPGPMTLIPDYNDRKHGGKWSLPHPIMKEVLDETYGIMVYQEQVMQICNRLGDIPLREAYTLIKAISKKKISTIQKEKERFIKGSVSKGLKNQQAQDIFELIERFAGYGFNKSHSTRYAFIAYQTAYMKVYWPVEYMAALLTFEMGNTDKVVEYISECNDMEIEVTAPDINESGIDFTPLYKENQKGMIRFGLAAVKGVGERAVEQIIVSRNKVGKFQSLFHFCENVDSRSANKQLMESLIKAGAFDRLGGSRPQMIAGLQSAMEHGSDTQTDKLNGQMRFFGQAVKPDYSQDHNRLPYADPWPEQMMLMYEKEVLGFYVTSNPLSHCAETINIFSNINTAQIAEATQEKEITIGGLITKIRYNVTKTGKTAGSKMAIFSLLDLQGQVEVVMFPKTFNEFAPKLTADAIVFIKGRLDFRREKPNIIASELITLNEATDKLAGRIRLNLDAKEITKEKIAEIKSICLHHRGRSSIYVTIRTDKGRVHASTDRALNVNPDPEFCRKIKHLIGPENFQFVR